MKRKADSDAMSTATADSTLPTPNSTIRASSSVRRLTAGGEDHDRRRADHHAERVRGDRGRRSRDRHAEIGREQLDDPVAPELTGPDGERPERQREQGEPLFAAGAAVSAPVHCRSYAFRCIDDHPRAAARMSFVVAAGLDTITACAARTRVTRAPARCAMNRWVAGGIALSSWRRGTRRERLPGGFAGGLARTPPRRTAAAGPHRVRDAPREVAGEAGAEALAGEVEVRSRPPATG